MAGPLLATKLHVRRRRPGLVARPRLSARLGRGWDAALTLLSAPAGFGKTTLLTEWLATAPGGRPTAWLSLDARDDDPVLFWTYLVTALDTAVPGVGARALALLQSPADREGLLAHRRPGPGRRPHRRPHRLRLTPATTAGPHQGPAVPVRRRRRPAAWRQSTAGTAPVRDPGHGIGGPDCRSTPHGNPARNGADLCEPAGHLRRLVVARRRGLPGLPALLRRRQRRRHR